MAFGTNSRAPLVSELSGAETLFGNFLLTNSRRLLGGFEITGVDPSSFSERDHLNLSLTCDSIFSAIPEECSLTQCRVRVPTDPVAFPPASDPLIDKMRFQRQDYLSGFPFLKTRIWHFIDWKLGNPVTRLSSARVGLNLVRAPFSQDARSELKNALSGPKTRDFALAEIEKTADKLHDVIETTMARWSTISETRRLSGPELTSALGHFLSPGAAITPPDEAIPNFSDLSPLIGNGDVSVVQLGSLTCLRLGGPDPLYARVASLVGFGKSKPGHWAQGLEPLIIDLPFPHALTVRWRKMSALETSLLFDTKRKELERKTLNIGSMLAGKTDPETKRHNLSSRLRKRFEELDHADALEVRWTHADANFIILGRTEAEIRDRSRALQVTCQTNGSRIVWESANLGNSYQNALPTGSGVGLRKLITNSAQNAALSVVHARASGAPEAFLQDPLDVFPSASLEPFSYFPWVGGRALCLGIGPTRSGKTFAKNALALQTLRFNSIYIAFDVDAGTEPLARVLGDRAAYFAIGENEKDGSRSGFNLFTSCSGPRDNAWRAHWIAQLKRMFTSDGGEPPTNKEIKELDQATEAILKIKDRKFHTLNHFAAMLSPDLGGRLARWTRADERAEKHDDGPWAWLTDCESDGFHSSRPFQVYNFAALRDSDALRAIAYAEIFHRITQLFEDDTNRAQMKFLDIDEAHIPLADEEFARWIVRGARTWNKFRVAVSLWSQALEEFTSVGQFEALRGAAATLMFTSNPTLPHESYQKDLGLSEGETDSIASLIPRREMMIVQREYNVSRRIDVRTDPWTELLLRSDPELVDQRNRLAREKGTIAAIDELLAQESNVREVAA